MNCSFDQYIKAAVEAGKYDVAAEMAQVIHEGYQLKIDRYPGKDIRVYKDNEGTTKVLCPKEMTYIQESNLTKSIALGTIFEDADTVDNHAKYITLTKFPVKGMKNVGLVDPYKVRECVGSTIGVMNEDGNVDVSDTDIKNGQNVIDDLISKDSTEFSNVKDIVDDYLGNDSHEYGYSIDFTKDIQGLRDEIQSFKDADISAEDSITDDDWNDDWGADSSIMDIEDDETVKGADTDKVSDDDDDESDDDDEMTYEEYCTMIEEPDTETVVQEGMITTLKKISYNPLTKTFITDIPSKEGKSGEKIKCKVKFGGPIASLNGPCFVDGNPPTIHIPVKDLLGDTDKLISKIKHEEGHLYVTLDRDHFNEDFANAKRLVDKHKDKLTEHGQSREEYVADLHSANTAGSENMIKVLKGFGFENRRRCAKLKRQINPKVIKKYFNSIKYRATHMPKTEDGQFIHKLKIETIKDLDALYNDMKKWGRDPVKELANRIIDDYNTSKLEKILMMDDNYRNRDYAGEANGKDTAHRLGFNVPGLTASIKRLSDQAEVFEKINKDCLSQLANLRDEISENKQRWNEFFGRMDNAIKDPERLSSMKNRFKQQQVDELNQLKVRKEQILANRREAIVDATPIVTKLNTLEKKILENIKAIHAGIDELMKSYDYTIKARIAYIRKYANKPTTESYTLKPFMDFGSNDEQPIVEESVTIESDDNTATEVIKEGATLTMEQINAFFQEAENEYVTDNKNTEGKIGTPDNKTDNVNSESPSQTQKTHVNESITDTDTVNLPPTEDDKKVDSGNSMSTPPTPGTESFTQESTPLLRPKKLKAIPIREIVAYATSEMNAIKDANDQAMLSGYVAAKLELVDFYIVVLDTNDARYVVPHSRQYLVDGQKQLNDLLTKILKIRPIDRTKRLWAAIL